MNTPATPIAIVRATIEDVPLIAPLFDGYRQFYKQPLIWRERATSLPSG